MFNYKKLRPIFCLPVGVEIDRMDKIIDYCFTNPTTETIMWLDDEKIDDYYLKGLWNNIADVTDNYLIRLGEDEWIYNLDDLTTIKENFLNSPFNTNSDVQKIIKILDYAIDHQRLPVVFYF